MLAVIIHNKTRKNGCVFYVVYIFALKNYFKSLVAKAGSK